MAWTTEKKLAYLLQLPWQIVTSRERDEGEEYFVARVMELPSVVATGHSEQDLERDF